MTLQTNQLFFFEKSTRFSPPAKKSQRIFLIYFFLFFITAIPYASAQSTQEQFLRTVHLNRNQQFDQAFISLSKPTYALSLAYPITTITIGLLKKDKQYLQKGYVGAVSLVGAMGAATILKYTINRPRPAEKYAFISPLLVENDPSFPSGHTTAAFVTATNLTLAFPKWYVYVPAYAWAIGVGYSRLHVGVHYPSDVLGGALLGTGSALLTYKLNQWWQKRR